MPKKSDALAASSAKVQAPAPITAPIIRAELKRFYPHPEYGVVFEVAQATGFSAHRHLDAIAMSTYPSRGLHLNGIEIKVSVHDWRRERRDPDKAEQLARFCDHFYIAAPKGIVPIADLPVAWGLLELDPLDLKRGIYVAKHAAKTPAQEPGRDFLAAIFRAANRPADPESFDHLLRERSSVLEADFEARVNEEAERRTRVRNDAAEYWTKLITALGDAVDAKDVLKWGLHGNDQIIRVISAVRLSGVMETWNGLATLQKQLHDMTSRVDAAMATLQIPPATDLDVLRDRTRKISRKK